MDPLFWLTAIRFRSYACGFALLLIAVVCVRFWFASHNDVRSLLRVLASTVSSTHSHLLLLLFLSLSWWFTGSLIDGASFPALISTLFNALRLVASILLHGKHSQSIGRSDPQSIPIHVASSTAALFRAVDIFISLITPFGRSSKPIRASSSSIWLIHTQQSTIYNVLYYYLESIACFIKNRVIFTSYLHVQKNVEH